MTSGWSWSPGCREGDISLCTALVLPSQTGVPGGGSHRGAGQAAGTWGEGLYSCTRRSGLRSGGCSPRSRPGRGWCLLRPPLSLACRRQPSPGPWDSPLRREKPHTQPRRDLRWYLSHHGSELSFSNNILFVCVFNSSH